MDHGSVSFSPDLISARILNALDHPAHDEQSGNNEKCVKHGSS
jgi:hypothetical protein